MGDGFSIQNYHMVTDSGILERVISMIKALESGFMQSTQSPM